MHNINFPDGSIKEYNVSKCPICESKLFHGSGKDFFICKTEFNYHYHLNLDLPSLLVEEYFSKGDVKIFNMIDLHYTKSCNIYKNNKAIFISNIHIDFNDIKNLSTKQFLKKIKIYTLFQ